MKRQRLQLLPTCQRSFSRSVWQRLSQLSLTIVLSGSVLLHAGLVRPPSAMAQPAVVATRSQTIAGKNIVGTHNFFANQPIASATATQCDGSTRRCSH